LDNAEAITLLRGELDKWRSLSWSALREHVGDTNVHERAGTSGTRYQVEVEIMWEYRPEGAILVIGSIDDGGWRAFSPLTEDFRIPPDGS
jgi:hypothetical protein